MVGGQDVAFNQVLGQEQIDLAIENGDLVAENGLETAVLISLFSDRFVPAEELPEGFDEQRGWWADSISTEPEDRIGSRLWLLERGKVNSKTKNTMKDYAEEALAWMISDGIASRIVVTTTLIVNQRIDMMIRIFRPDGDDIPFKFVWDGQEMKRG